MKVDMDTHVPEPMLLPSAAGRVGTQYTYAGKTQSISAWAREFRIPRSLLKYRLQRANWPIEKALTMPVTPAALANTVSRDFKPDHAMTRRAP